MGSSVTNTSAQSKNPPNWLDGVFKNVAQNTQNAYNNGVGSGVYNGQRVADLSGQTQSGIAGIRGVANQYGQNPSYLSNPTFSQKNLSAMASGEYLKNGNPYFRDRLNQTVDDANSAIQRQFAGSGRLGSVSNVNAIGRNTNYLLNQGLEADYNRGLEGMRWANSQIDAANNAQTNTQNSWLQGADAANRNLVSAGGLIDQNNQAKLNASQAQFNEQQNAPYLAASRLLQSILPISNQYGSSTATQTQNRSAFNNLSGLLGLLSSLGLSFNQQG